MKRKRKSQETTIPCDEQLLKEIAPIGNVKHYDTFSRTGTGYEACIHIFDYPSMLNDFWLQSICTYSNTIADQH